MSLAQFNNSIRSIFKNRHINRTRGVIRHLHWQWKKAFDRFPHELRISDSRILAGHKRCGVSALINSQGLYNYNNMNLIKLALKDGGIFFDVGANIGSYSLIASEQEKAQIFSFEPHPATFDMLRFNVELNGRNNVRILNFALGDKNGESFLTNEPGSAMNHFEVGKGEAGIEVTCRRGDEICAEYGVFPTLLKIDVEGFEFDVLTGFGSTLKEVELIFVEINGLSDRRAKGAEAINNLLRDNGFSGPYYFNFDDRTLSKFDNSEDPIFISKRFIGEIGSYENS